MYRTLVMKEVDFQLINNEIKTKLVCVSGNNENFIKSIGEVFKFQSTFEFEIVGIKVMRGITHYYMGEKIPEASADYVTFYNHALDKNKFWENLISLYLHE